MDTRLLKMFRAVAEGGSLVKAAAQLHLTASALSHGLKGLETELGCRLFERVGKKLLLNQAGEQLLAQVRPALDALDAAAESVKRLSQWGQTRLRVGAPASACHHIIPGVIREMKKTYPHLQMLVGSGDTPELVERLQDNELDLVLGIAPQNLTGLEARTIFRDEMMLVFAPSHPWASGRPVTADEALAIGLATQVVDDGQALPAAQALAAHIAAFPQACMLADRASAYGQWDLPLAEALQREGASGFPVIAAEAVAGAARFAAGAGRHGRFGD